MTIRIAQFVSGDLWAGAEVMAFNLIRELSASEDLTLCALILNDGMLAQRLSTLGIELTVVREDAHTLAGLCAATRAFVARWRPNIIHSHRYKENILACLAAGCGRRSRLLATQHGLPEGPPRRYFSRAGSIARLNRLLLRRRFDRVVGVSANICEVFRTDFGIPADRLVQIHNGIELPLPTARSMPATELVIGSAGRLFPVKDYPLMVATAAAVARSLPQARFLLAGDGPQRIELEQLIGLHRLTSFTLAGQQDDMPAFYARLDVYLNTSQHEGIPMSILEAMAHGLPVVAPAVGGIGEIIEDGVDGFLVTGRDPEAFAAPLLRLQDAALRRRIGDAARDKVCRAFSAGAMASHYLEQYRMLAG